MTQSGAAGAVNIPKYTAEVFKLLAQAALECRTITYGEIADKTGLTAHGLGPQLNYIHYHVCVPRGLPWLTSLVVRTDSRKPGIDWSATWNSDGNQANADSIWRMAVAQVIAYTGWDKVEF